MYHLIQRHGAVNPSLVTSASRTRIAEFDRATGPAKVLDLAAVVDGRGAGHVHRVSCYGKIIDSFNLDISQWKLSS